MASISSLRCFLSLLCLSQAGVLGWSIPQASSLSGLLAGGFDEDGGLGVVNRREVTSGTEHATTTTTDYVFNATANDITIAYYGQTNMTQYVNLTQLCSGLSLDIITLGFVSGFYGSKGALNISMDFNGYLCKSANETQIAAGMGSLLDCVGDRFAAEVAACQAMGKKVLLSVGGASANLTIPSTKAATALAQTLWDLFLGGDGYKGKGVRPFGSVVLDGLDIGMSRLLRYSLVEAFCGKCGHG